MNLSLALWLFWLPACVDTHQASNVTFQFLIKMMLTRAIFSHCLCYLMRVSTGYLRKVPTCTPEFVAIRCPSHRAVKRDFFFQLCIWNNPFGWCGPLLVTVWKKTAVIGLTNFQSLCLHLVFKWRVSWKRNARKMLHPQLSMESYFLTNGAQLFSFFI